MTPSARCLLAMLALLVTVPAEAGTWKVGRNQTDCPGGCNFHDGTLGGGPGEGIYSAMVSASVLPGDTVRVWPGEYGKRFDMKSGVTLVSQSGPEVTIIRGAAGAAPAATFAGTNSATVIDGFTFRWSGGPPSFGGGLGIFAAEGTIKNNIFRRCTAGLGSAIYLQSAYVTVQNNVFTRNETQSGGGTVSISGGAPILRSNTFYANAIPFGYEGVDIYSVGSDFVLERNIIADSQGGAGIFCAGEQSATIGCNIVWNVQFGAFGGTCGDMQGIDGNVTANPLLCDPVVFDFGVCTDSPALNGPCGVIGYLSPGGNCPPCAPTPVSQFLEPLSWGRVKARYQ